MFDVIAGSGHCGTKWLATVLNSVPGATWHHEMRTEITRLPWYVLDLYEPDDAIFSSYWTFIRQQPGSGGDANSWPPELLPAVNEVVPIRRIIYLTRDKDKQLHSLQTKSPVWSGAISSKAASHKLGLYAEISGLPRDARLLVEANDFMPGWLRSMGLHVDTYSLEDITTSLAVLKELAPSLTGVELAAWQQKKINQKVFA